MDYIITKSDGSEALYHHGIKGQKWGIRKYQNPDGTYTDAGKNRYISKKIRAIDKDIASIENHKKGYKNKKGQTVLSKEEIASMVDGLLEVRNKKIEKYSNKWDKQVEYYKDKSNYKDIKKIAKKDKSIKKTKVYKTARAKRYKNIVDKLVNTSTGYGTNKFYDVNNQLKASMNRKYG